MGNNGPAFEQTLIRESLTQRDKALMLALFFGESGEQNMRTIFEDLDLDTESIVFQLALSMLGFQSGWESFPPEVIPRVKGLHRYYQVDCAMKFSWLSGILHALDQAGIPAMLVKGGAMYVHYRKGSPRLMDDFDLAVPEKDFERAAEMIRHLGCKQVGSSAWAVTFQEKVFGRTGYIDLHRRAFKNNEASDARLWENAVQAEFQGTKVLVPAPEDMLLHLLDNQIRNLLYNEYPERRIKWVFDCLTLREAFPDVLRPDALRARSETFCDTYYIQLAIRMLSAWFPGLFPEGEQEKSFPADAGYRNWLRRAAAFHSSFIAADRYPPGSPLTPRHLLLASRRWIREYRFMGPELSAQYGNISLMGYVLRQTGNGTLGSALKNYVPRLSLRKSAADTEEKT